MRKRRKRRFLPERITRRRSHGSTNRWGIDFSDAIPGAMLEFVGTAISQQLSKYPNVPETIRNAPVSALGLYALGVAFNRESWRSLGAGQVLGRMLGIFKP